MAATFWLDGHWTDEAPRLTGPADHSFWQSSVIFDGARAIAGLAPDLDLHCRRAIASAHAMALKPGIAAEEIERLAIEGIRRFPRDAVLYIKPVFYAAGGMISADSATTAFVLHIFEAPLPGAGGFSATLSPLRRPAPEMAPTDAKAACLYPNSDRATREANGRGFDHAVMRDPWDNIAEFAFANLMLVKGGRVLTPAANGTFLAGITRRRVMALLNEAGTEAVEAKLTAQDLHDADEIFSCGNYGKVVACTRFEDRQLNAGPVFTEARRRYFAWAEGSRVN
ncbi:branched-chain amino acid aminotransferase [Limobrevibacterium gyesilva]|uniref:Probable branched-chain-amino-acid aminotransferase n=1 Tax=Limobrevibacterium gyesilva TaxID=2991712 RepID=A0AA42CEF5_9PROT|nr:branched-chain amino acid aminotransferase [Limobrevibacterium gyesilva]MCW3475219.1 branched-chain amino acid aminotransferase [Limobrevibacterium gyesilva]